MDTHRESWRTHILCVLTISRATYGETARRPITLILLGIFAVAVFFSRTLTLFSFYQETPMVREMGIATLSFWGFLILALTSGLLVTHELEDRTAVTLLSKPVRREHFLLGKYLGLLAALVPGLVVLSGALFLTLWFMIEPHLPIRDRDVALGLARGVAPYATVWNGIWTHFIAEQGGVVLQGALLALLQCAVLGAVAVSFAAFFPVVVSVGATTAVFVLGNLSSYMLSSLETLGSGTVSALGRTVSYLFPNLGYFNLQTYFSEGRIISARYLGWSLAYAALYVAAVFLVSCSLFRNREVR
jgi:ABC-type transport system involved in multi-copper enzyme maturation permease subunit